VPPALRIGVLAFHGDVSEHADAMAKAAAQKKRPLEIVYVRRQADAEGLDGLIIPGGESTTLYKLCEREGMLDELRTIKCIFGTCAGAIMLARRLEGAAENQKTLALMDITVDRNAYGRQSDSFQTEIETKFGPIEASFIRAPRIVKLGAGVDPVAHFGGEVIGCEQTSGGRYYLALTFHPELTTPAFHEYFLTKL